MTHFIQQASCIKWVTTSWTHGIKQDFDNFVGVFSLYTYLLSWVRLLIRFILIIVYRADRKKEALEHFVAGKRHLLVKDLEAAVTSLALVSKCPNLNPKI